MINKKRYSISIVLPTFNEKENIKILIPELEKFFQTYKECILKEIVVVDDYSPDNTAGVCIEMNRKYGNIVLIQKQKEGIGAALQKGYFHAKGDIIVSMDSDLSFEVDDIKKLLEKIEQGYDLVLGCRHLIKGHYEKKELATKIKGTVSSLGNKLIPLFTGIKLHDFSANFRAVKNNVWKSIDVQDQTNFMLLEMIIKTKKKGFKITETPVTFKERVYGKSKLNLFVESLRFLYKIIFSFY